MTPLIRGETFERYRIEELLGEGGMGTVYRAFDERLRRPVALKLLRRDANAGTERAAARKDALLREARAAAALSHPNAVAIYDVGESYGTSFIAMELVDGQPLRALVGDASVAMTERIRILADIARGLAAAHDRGLIHSDVKPENVMVAKNGAVKVLDFGIARDATLEELQASAYASATGGVAGTPRYMAPEQIRSEALDGRADQFSWGVLAYELLTGRAPWAGDPQSLALAAAIQRDDPPPPREIEPSIPKRVEAIVLRALEKDRADRFESMHELLGGLVTRPRAPAVSRGPLPRRISSDDVRRALRLIAESSELLAAGESASRHLLAGLAELTRSQIATQITVTGFADGTIPVFTDYQDVGWGTDADRTRLYEYVSTNGITGDPLSAATFGRLGDAATLTRSDAMSTAEWDRSATRHELHRPAGIDDSLMSVVRIKGDGLYRVLVLKRAWGEPAFGEQERGIVHLVHSECSWLFERSS